MYGLNEVTLVGTLASEPNINSFETGKIKADIFLAINEKEPRKEANGETKYQDVVRFTSIEFWGGNAKFIRDYLKKGDHVSIVGKVNRSSWEDEAGQKKSRQYIEGRNITTIGGIKKADKAKAVLSWLDKAEQKGQSLAEAKAELQQILAHHETINQMA